MVTLLFIYIVIIFFIIFKSLYKSFVFLKYPFSLREKAEFLTINIKIESIPFCASTGQKKINLFAFFISISLISLFGGIFNCNEVYCQDHQNSDNDSNFSRRLNQSAIILESFNEKSQRERLSILNTQKVFMDTFYRRHSSSITLEDFILMYQTRDNDFMLKLAQLQLYERNLISSIHTDMTSNSPPMPKRFFFDILDTYHSTLVQDATIYSNFINEVSFLRNEFNLSSNNQEYQSENLSQLDNIYHRNVLRLNATKADITRASQINNDFNWNNPDDLP